MASGEHMQAYDLARPVTAVYFRAVRGAGVTIRCAEAADQLKVVRGLQIARLLLPAGLGEFDHELTDDGGLHVLQNQGMPHEFADGTELGADLPPLDSIVHKGGHATLLLPDQEEGDCLDQIKAEVDRGKVAVADLRVARMVVKSGAGDIELTRVRASSAELRTRARGTATLTEVAAKTLAAKTWSGDITVTGGGNWAIEDDEPAWQLETWEGNVLLADDPAGVISTKTTCLLSQNAIHSRPPLPAARR